MLLLKRYIILDRFFYMIMMPEKYGEDQYNEIKNQHI